MSAEQSVEEIYRRYAPVIHRRSRQLLGNEEDALDAVQDIFMNMQKKLGTFRGEANMMTWVYRVTTNHCLNVLRSRRTKRRVLETLGEAPATVDHGPARQLERRELLTKLLARFSARQVQIVLYHYADEMTQAEIAEVIGISERAVRKALKRVKDQAGAELAALEATP